MAAPPSYEDRYRLAAVTMAASSRGPSGVSASRPSLTACAGTCDTILAALLRRAGRLTRFEFALFSRRLFDLCFPAINSIPTLVDRLTCASKLAWRYGLDRQLGKKCRCGAENFIEREARADFADEHGP